MGFNIADLNPIAAAADAVTNPLFAHLTNVKNRKFTREMYNRQRQDALSDWAMQNEYNSPRAQMQRYQEAGLNPHLIYGQSNEGATVRSSSASGGAAEAPRTDFGGKALQIYDMKARSAQVDLLAKQLSIADEDILLKRAQQFATIASAGRNDADTKRILFDLGVKSELRDTTIEGAKAGVELTKANIKSTLDENERRQAMLAPNYLKAVEEVLNLRISRDRMKVDMDEMRARIRNLGYDALIKAYEVALNKKGVQKNDNIVTRLLGSFVDGILQNKSVKEVTDEIKKDFDIVPNLPWPFNPVLPDKRR